LDRSIQGWVKPNDSRSILSVHYYTPYQFCIQGSRTTWGSTTDLALLQSQLGRLKTAFLDKGVPVILGEFGAMSETEAASRVYWLEYVTKTCRDLGVAPYFWDNGSEFDRARLTWRTPGILDAFKRAASGQAYTITKGP
jgi:endoglucanase